MHCLGAGAVQHGANAGATSAKCNGADATMDCMPGTQSIVLTTTHAGNCNKWLPAVTAEQCPIKGLSWWEEALRLLDATHVGILRFTTQPQCDLADANIKMLVLAMCCTCAAPGSNKHDTHDDKAPTQQASNDKPSNG